VHFDALLFWDGVSFHVSFYISQVPPALSGKPVVEIAVTSHILHGTEKMTTEFAEGLKKYPDWMYAHGWTATYSHWSF
jgi:hypothetical protein